MTRTNLRRNGAATLTGLACAASIALVPTAADAAAKGPDLTVFSPAVDRGTVVEGGTLTVTHRVKNPGTVKAGAAHTRYYLTRDPAASLAERRASRTNPRSALADVLLAGTTATPSLAPTKQSPVLRAKVTVPVGVRPGTYRVLACADDRGVVRERTETNNCAAATRPVVVTAAPGTADLTLAQYADTATWPEDESLSLQWMKIGCGMTQPARTMSTAAALTGIEAFVESGTDSNAVQRVASSGMADTAAEAQNLAAAAVAEGSPGLAIAALLRARQLEPRIGTHHVNLAALATSVGLPNEALALLDGAVGLDHRPTPFGMRPQVMSLVVRGQALVMTGRLPAARSAYAAARVAEPLLSEADAGLAVVEACAGNDALAMRYARAARLRSDEPRKATEDPTRPEKERPRAALDLSKGVATPLRRLPMAETPAQGVRMTAQYDDIDAGFQAEIAAEQAEADAIRERMDAADEARTRAEIERRAGISALAYQVGTGDDVAEQLQTLVHDQLDEISAHREEFFGGGTGELSWTYRDLSDEATESCEEADDFDGCYLQEMNATCRPALSAAHTEWRGLMGRAQLLAEQYVAELSTQMSAYAANLADPDAHRDVLLQVEGAERATYALLVQQAQQWTGLERLHERECVTPLEVQPEPTPEDVDAASPGRCPKLMKAISVIATLGPSELKIECEKVSQELAVEAIPFLNSFIEVAYDFRSGKVTVFAGSKFKAGVGPVEAGFKSGLYVTTDGQGSFSDVGWRVGPDAAVSATPVQVQAYEEMIDLSFVSAPSTGP